MELSPSNFLLSSSNRKILGNICFSEQIFYRKQSLGAPDKHRAKLSPGLSDLKETADQMQEAFKQRRLIAGYSSFTTGDFPNLLHP